MLIVVSKVGRARWRVDNHRWRRRDNYFPLVYAARFHTVRTANNNLIHTIPTISVSAIINDNLLSSAIAVVHYNLLCPTIPIINDNFFSSTEASISIIDNNLLSPTISAVSIIVNNNFFAVAER